MLRLLFAIAISTTASAALGDATIPTADRKGSKDSPLLKRYDGSLIVAYEHKAFAEFTLPLSALTEVPDKKTTKNNRYHEPKNKKALEGTYTRLAYLIPTERSPLEVLRNYQDEIKAAGGQILVSPDCNPAVIGAAAAAGLISCPGYLTPSEAFSALRAGAHGLKLFPAEAASPAALKAQLAVIPSDVPIIVVGGVKRDHMQPWLDAGAAGFGLGGGLYSAGQSADETHARARAFVAALAPR